jgi:mono/diheme cytochrome c family protein
MSCAACHGALANQQNVQNGANNPSAIIKGINNASGMSIYKGVFNDQQLADLAAFIATPY